MPQFTVSHLQDDRLEEILPLLRMAAPLATAGRWRDFVRWTASNDGGILAAVAGDGRPHGIAAYRIEESLIHGRTMRVDPMVTFEINRSAPVRAALCEALERLARARGCDGLAVAAASRGYADPQSPKAGAWASMAFKLDSVVLVKRLEPPRSTSAHVAQ